MELSRSTRVLLESNMYIRVQYPDVNSVEFNHSNSEKVLKSSHFCLPRCHHLTAQNLQSTIGFKNLTQNHTFHSWFLQVYSSIALPADQHLLHAVSQKERSMLNLQGTSTTFIVMVHRRLMRIPITPRMSMQRNLVAGYVKLLSLQIIPFLSLIMAF